MNNMTNRYENDYFDNSSTTFLIAMLISAGPFLFVALLILFVCAILKRIFSCRKAYVRKHNAKHVKLLENYLNIISETNDKIDSRERAYVRDEIKIRTRHKDRRTAVSINEINILERKITEQKLKNSMPPSSEAVVGPSTSADMSIKRDEYPLMELCQDESSSSKIKPRKTI